MVPPPVQREQEKKRRKKKERKLNFHEEYFLSKEWLLGRNALHGLGLAFLASAFRNSLISIEKNGSWSHAGRALMLKEKSFEAGGRVFTQSATNKVNWC